MFPQQVREKQHKMQLMLKKIRNKRICDDNLAFLKIYHIKVARINPNSTPFQLVHKYRPSLYPYQK